MTVNLSELKRIKSSDTNLIFGYYREAHTQLLPQDNPYYDIQPLIVYTCLAFYHIRYEWDTENLSDECFVNGDFIEKKSERFDTTSLLKGEISNGIHEYKFEIISYSADKGYYDIGVGIIGSEHFANKPGLINECFHEDHTGYGYITSTADKEVECFMEEYGIKCEKGNIVTMTVDLEKYELKYTVNETDLGVAFTNIEQITYRVGIYLYRKGCKVRILP